MNKQQAIDIYASTAIWQRQMDEQCGRIISTRHNFSMAIDTPQEITDVADFTKDAETFIEDSSAALEDLIASASQMRGVLLAMVPIVSNGQINNPRLMGTGEDMISAMDTPIQPIRHLPYRRTHRRIFEPGHLVMDNNEVFRAGVPTTVAANQTNPVDGVIAMMKSALVGDHKEIKDISDTIDSLLEVHGKIGNEVAERQISDTIEYLMKQLDTKVKIMQAPLASLAEKGEYDANIPHE